VISVLGVLLLVWFVPEPLTGAAFVVFILLLLLLLDSIVKLISTTAEKLSHNSSLDGMFALRMAVAGLYRPGASLRPMLLSLGTALTLLVASALVITSTRNTLLDTVPENAPSLVFYDLQKDQVQNFNSVVADTQGYKTHAVAPLVLGRLTRVNGENLTDSKNIDNTTVDRGEWWPDDYSGPPLVAMEDREADQLELKTGDKLQFSIMGQTIDVTLAAIYTQARFQTSFWLEAVFTDKVLDPFISRHIGSVASPYVPLRYSRQQSQYCPVPALR